MIRFCAACGAALPTRPPVTCGACGTRHWANAKPCAAALVVANGCVLLTRRARAPWQGLWCAPSGFCDGPEHPIEAAERETREEVGLEVRVVGYLGTWVDPYADPGEDAVEHVSVQYYAAVPLGEPQLTPDPHEVVEAAWWPVGAPPTGLAPPGTLDWALAALAAAFAGPGVETALPDRPLRG